MWRFRNTIGNLVLKSKIKGMAEQVKRDRINRKRGRLGKSPIITRQLGSEIRIHQLAYGMIKGVPYSVLERTCKDKPSAKKVLMVIHQHIPNFEIPKWTLEIVESMLSVEMPEVENSSSL